MMQKIVDWFIKLLGGITKTEFSNFKTGCGDFAKEELKPKDEGSIIVKHRVYSCYGNEHLYILDSRRSVVGSNVKGITVAPWCEDIFIMGNIFNHKNKQSHE